MVDGWFGCGPCVRLNGFVVFCSQSVCRYVVVRLNMFVVGGRGLLVRLVRR